MLEHSTKLKLKLLGNSTKKELRNTKQKEFIIEIVIKRKGDKLYFKQKGHDNSFNSSIDKKGLEIMTNFKMNNNFR